MTSLVGLKFGESTKESLQLSKKILANFTSEKLRKWEASYWYKKIIKVLVNKVSNDLPNFSYAKLSLFMLYAISY